MTESSALWLTGSDRLALREQAVVMETADDQRVIINAQHEHWESTFAAKPDMFGTDASYPAQVAVRTFRSEKKPSILELGAGQGRDTLYFARNGFNVMALDYSKTGLNEIERHAKKAGVSISTRCHDVRKPLPFDDAAFDAVYSHMLYCMALTTAELVALSSEIRRILKPSGLNVFTVRTTQDAHYGSGIHRGEAMYEVGGFVMHFFDREKVRQVSAGYDLVSIEQFEEGGLPRKLFLVTLRKPTTVKSA